MCYIDLCFTYLLTLQASEEVKKVKFADMQFVLSHRKMTRSLLQTDPRENQNMTQTRSRCLATKHRVSSLVINTVSPMTTNQCTHSILLSNPH